MIFLAPVAAFILCRALAESSCVKPVLEPILEGAMEVYNNLPPLILPSAPMLYYYRNELTGKTTWERPPATEWKLIARASDDLVPGMRGPGKGGGRDGVGAWTAGNAGPDSTNDSGLAIDRTEGQKVEDRREKGEAMAESPENGHAVEVSTGEEAGGKLSGEAKVLDEQDGQQQSRTTFLADEGPMVHSNIYSNRDSTYPETALDHEHHEEEHSELAHVAAAGLPTHYYYDQSTGRTSWDRPIETAWVKVPVMASRRAPLLDIITAIVIDVMGLKPPPAVGFRQEQDDSRSDSTREIEIDEP
jgi:hypothetical protein